MSKPTEIVLGMPELDVLPMKVGQIWSFFDPIKNKPIGFKIDMIGDTHMWVQDIKSTFIDTEDGPRTVYMNTYGLRPLANTKRWTLIEDVP